MEDGKYYLGLDLSTQQGAMNRNLASATTPEYLAHPNLDMDVTSESFQVNFVSHTRGVVTDARFGFSDPKNPWMLKAVVINDKLQPVCNDAVIFQTELPEFRTSGGVIVDNNDPHHITVPTIMWVKALDMLLDRMTVAGVDFSKIAAVSGTAQQHGSVYWAPSAESLLSNLNPSQFLHDQLVSAFTVPDSPIWMDSTTTEQCRQLEEAVGGAENLAAITGSRAYERFTGSQIAKIYQDKPDAYQRTHRISLVSSFLCSLFLDKIAPIDFSDGSGMNLMDINTKKWNQILLDTCGPDLALKLGDPVPSSSIVGSISTYLVERHNFNPDCQVIAFTGDNPASLIGMGVAEGWIAVSLGTSDTVFLWLSEPRVVLDGHVLCNPIDQNAYMALLCFKNGSLTRERIKDDFCEGKWETFNELLDSTPRGNFGNLGLYFDTQEILPFLKGDYRFSKEGPVSKFNGLEVEVRAVVEGQFIAKRAYTEDFGFQFDENTKILATGGASVNKSVLQVLSDVFNAPVYVQEAADSAMLGAAYQAKFGYSGDPDFGKILESIPKPQLACEPYSDAAEVYAPMVERYRNIINELVCSTPV